LPSKSPVLDGLVEKIIFRPVNALFVPSPWLPRGFSQAFDCAAIVAIWAPLPACALKMRKHANALLWCNKN
jgi:hypothetical protein